MNEIAVIGAGAWGTALAIQAARAGHGVVLWARDPAKACEIQQTRANARLPGARLPDAIHVTATLPHRRIALLAVPMQHLRAILAQLPAPEIAVACAKGLERSSLCLPLEILAACHPSSTGLVLTGPNFAHEIAARLPAAAIVAGHAGDARSILIECLATPGFRLYASDDPLAAQIGGAAKNVIAIAAGAAIGAGLGENARAALITRGLAEITRLAVALGGHATTVAGLSGLGDLLLTCTSARSRNTSLGLELGRGVALAEILTARSTVAEGLATAPALVARAAAAGVDLPICEAVARVVTGRSTIADEIVTLLDRPLRPNHDETSSKIR